jgi:hypothetical protein
MVRKSRNIVFLSAVLIAVFCSILLYFRNEEGVSIVILDSIQNDPLQVGKEGPQQASSARAKYPTKGSISVTPEKKPTPQHLAAVTAARSMLKDWELASRIVPKYLNSVSDAGVGKLSFIVPPISQNIFDEIVAKAAISNKVSREEINKEILEYFGREKLSKYTLFSVIPGSESLPSDILQMISYSKPETFFFTDPQTGVIKFKANAMKEYLLDNNPDRKERYGHLFGVESIPDSK